MCVCGGGALAFQSIQNVEIGSDVWADLAERFLSFLSVVRDTWEGDPLCGSVLQQFLSCHLKAAGQFLCHQLLLQVVLQVYNGLDKRLHVSKEGMPVFILTFSTTVAPCGCNGQNTDTDTEAEVEHVVLFYSLFPREGKRGR